MTDNNSHGAARQQRGPPVILTIKHLAREYGVKPRLVRAILRARYGHASSFCVGREWQFHTVREAREIRKLLTTLLGDGRAGS
jgi:hypothetical protein